MAQEISVIGLGKLGGPLVAALASRGFKVIGVDVNQKFVDLINQKKAPVNEPLLAEYLQQYGQSISATTSFKEAINNSDISLIIVPTPSKSNHEFSTKFAEKAVKEIGKVLKKKKKYHLIVLVSTVLPLACEKKIIPALEKASGKKCGQKFGFCYGPEFIALGSVIQNLLNPDFILIGEFDKKSGDILEYFYKKFTFNKAPIKRMSLVNAEITKISLNSYITTKISFANQLAELCERIPGGHIDDVTAALGLDRRISPYYLKGGTSFGGTCFPRDTKAFIALNKRFGLTADLIKATDRVNKKQNERLVEIVMNNLPSLESKVAILGLSFKPTTPVIEESVALHVISQLLSRKITLLVHDPLALAEIKKQFGDLVEYIEDAYECIKKARLLVITSPDPVYKNIDLGVFKDDHVIIDCWRIFNGLLNGRNIKYIPLGIHS